MMEKHETFPCIVSFAIRHSRYEVGGKWWKEKQTYEVGQTINKRLCVVEQKWGSRKQNYERGKNASRTKIHTLREWRFRLQLHSDRKNTMSKSAVIHVGKELAIRAILRKVENMKLSDRRRLENKSGFDFSIISSHIGHLLSNELLVIYILGLVIYFYPKWFYEPTSAISSFSICDLIIHASKPRMGHYTFAHDVLGHFIALISPSH